ncbi:dTDP-4-dehydrorhamnose 3,5-epimerase family protein [Polynucleobacter sp. AP-Feld-500C-C5]|uniref:dTDP-4-dehydrorhamnose 3,5-epimerase family protein n=1 Tax=Polynucleobacter sp. AP-Feld-500C-C5 TaxID=2576924 RepID=UPI001C0AE335|nr:dTDP-4-dehydrorhamnose 3,5-epimerase family protein [Polynucleobacter sp. AP-Feld-500C-C5]MBU3632891.1 dTDP-4-dehydrorhamnose 3,5-epimerase family protein [Polynucleobacter sp. AP-Feld-500C-C5]
MQKIFIEKLNFSGLFRMVRNPFKDDRGEFSRIFCTNELSKVGWDKPIVQINRSTNYYRGTVRGLHYQQPPFSEKKIIMCESGRVWDVVVDIRAGSTTFLQYHIEELSEDSDSALIVPEGFAHGFQVLEDNTKLIYIHSEFYAESYQKGLNVKDPSLSISWPLEIKNLSSKDRDIEMINANFMGVNINEM